MRRLLPTAAAVMTAAGIVACGARAGSAEAPRAAAAPVPAVDAAALPRLDAATALLVVAPHPDDETLCCAGVIQRVLSGGGRVSVVWITSGDAERLELSAIERILFGDVEPARRLGSERMAEARTATALLGVRPSGQLFLGYPDAGVQSLLAEHRTAPYSSPYTAAASVPYADALFPGHPYTGESLERDFSSVLDRVQPTLILAPSPLDAHPDHRAAGLLTIAVSARHRSLPLVHYWIVHGGEDWPSPRDLLPGVPLTAPPLGRGLALSSFTLEPAEEDRKLAALKAHRTQMRVMAPFLLAFVRTTELFFALPPAQTLSPEGSP